MRRFCLVILLGLICSPAMADCYEGMPFCFNGDGETQKRVKLVDGAKAATGGDAFLAAHPAPSVDDIKEACRNKDLKGDICKAGNGGRKTDAETKGIAQ